MKKIFLLVFLFFVTGISTNKAQNYRDRVTFNYFYYQLLPYGQWIEINNNLYAWKPDRVSWNWKPYSIGRWAWTSYGWYWNSYEPFGWATYHYGRWFYDDYYGWIWIPDYQWAPAWVEWRYNNNYIGWAPLPPYAGFSINFGIRFSVRWNFGYNYWNFVPYRYFYNVNVNNYYIDNRTVYNIFNKTRIRNDYFYRDGRIINRGVNRSFVERRMKRRIRRVNVLRTRSIRDYRNRIAKREIRAFIPTRAEVSRFRNRVPNLEQVKSVRRTSLKINKIAIRKQRNFKRNVNRSGKNIRQRSNRNKVLRNKIRHNGVKRERIGNKKNTRKRFNERLNRNINSRKYNTGRNFYRKYELRNHSNEKSWINNNSKRQFKNNNKRAHRIERKRSYSTDPARFRNKDKRQSRFIPESNRIRNPRKGNSNFRRNQIKNKRR